MKKVPMNQPFHIPDKTVYPDRERSSQQFLTRNNAVITVITIFLVFASFIPRTGHYLPADTKKQDSTLLSGDWYLVPVLPSDTATGKFPSLHFNIAQKKFTGFTGCNQMSGAFVLIANELRFDKNIILTKMVCEGFNEKEFMANLLRVDHYSITNGVLTLLIDKTPVSKWMRRKNNEIV